ncbi:MAG: radical SAM protein [Chloroflexi bacterium]|nr:radical SAM protein [Chloroflexota bacterium]
MGFRNIQAKTLLTRMRHPDGWFGATDNINLYRGCQHRCIYCDTRSECYQVDTFDEEILVKANAVELLRSELAARRKKGIVSTGSMNDPYMPLEAELRLTRRTLATIAEAGWGVHITTKSALVLRDVDLLQVIGPERASVLMTVTTADDALGRMLEPYASSVSERFAALAELAQQGITTGLALMPVLPFIEDDAANIQGIIERAAECGVHYLACGFGVTLRDRQRAYYYRELERSFPGLSARYRESFGNAYYCASPRTAELQRLANALCRRYHISEDFCREPSSEPRQLNLFQALPR